MSRVQDFREEFERTYEITNRASRGKALEKLLGKFLKTYGFKVNFNPKGARPRQSDLFAHFEDNSVLIEVKWQKRKVDVGDIDSLRSRLERSSIDIIGAIFSMSGFSKTAILEVERYRTREIMLFTPFEMAALFNREIDIHKLIEMKRDLLRADGIAWFYEGQKRIKTSHKLEKDSKSFFKQGEFFISSSSESSDMIDSLFARTIPDTNWGNYSDYSALLQLDLDINNIEDLEEVLCLIDELFGLSNEGSYSIKQWNRSEE